MLLFVFDYSAYTFLSRYSLSHTIQLIITIKKKFFPSSINNINSFLLKKTRKRIIVRNINYFEYCKVSLSVPFFLHYVHTIRLNSVDISNHTARTRQIVHQNDEVVQMHLLLPVVPSEETRSRLCYPSPDFKGTI